MGANISTILECSRAFSLPMTIMSWLVVFTYALLGSGNALYGILALVGVSLAHMGTNVLDDYLDYKNLIKQVDFDKKEYLNNSQKTKCRYLISGVMRESQVKLLIAFYFALAGIIGLFFYIKCGKPVLYFASIGGFIAVFYSILSRFKLSEFAVGIAYGPALFGGVYYVMTNTMPMDVFILSIPTMLMTVVLLYIHTVMDFDYDLKENHLTIANSFDSRLDSLVVLKILLILAYASTVLLCIFDIADWQVFLTALTIILAVDLYKSMFDYSNNPKSVPEHKWYHFPMENMKRLRNAHAEAFMIRMYQSRNLMIYFSAILALGLCLSSL
ncbi:prenyltransferase [bacterium]|nr:prenyltransferase [bacterium]